MSHPPPPLPDADPFVKAVDEAAADYKSNPTESSRIKLREAALALHQSLETIAESVFRVSFGPSITQVVVRTAVEGKWFEHLLKSGKPVTADELSKATGAERGLIVRCMRVLITEGIVTEVGRDTYGPARNTVAFTIPGLEACIIHSADNVLPALATLPQYLANTRFKEPQDDTLGPYVIAHSKGFWNHMTAEPERRKNFNIFMTGRNISRGGVAGWLDVFPIEERLKRSEPVEPQHPEPENKAKDDIPPPTMVVEKVDPDQPSHGEVPGTDAAAMREADAAPDEIKIAPEVAINGQPVATKEPVFIVDIGGGNGHDLLEFRHRFPKSTHPGRAILQDLPDTVANLDVVTLSSAGIEVLPHNFFNPQPIHGAQFYYLAAVIHDWSDMDATIILNMIRPAMKINHSSILVIDLVVPEERVPYWHTMLDITLMVLMCGKERSGSQLRALVEPCGLRVLGVHMLETGEGVTELVLEGDERLKGWRPKSIVARAQIA